MAGHLQNPTQPEVQPPSRWLPLLICLFLALAVWIIFGQTLHHGFVFDDLIYVTENPHVQQGLTSESVAWAFHHTVGANWHPLTVLTHMLDCQLYGLRPAGHHLTNVLLHAAAAILLFLMLRSMTGALWPAAFVAAVFAVHPLRVESVAWVAERKDVLSGVFFMLTLWAYFCYAQPTKTQNSNAKAWYLLALLLFALGLMAKPMLVTIPFVLLLLDYWPLNRLGPDAPATPQNVRRTFIRLVLEKVPFLLLAVGDCVATVLAQKDAINPVTDLPLSWRIGNALAACAAYLRQMVYPVGLAVFYPHPENRLSAASIGWSALVLLIISAGAIAGWRKYPYLLVGWLWYLGMLVPVIGIVQVGNQARADRYTYLPQIGLYLALAWGAAELCRSWRLPRIVPAFGAVAILAGLLVGAYIQTTYWQDSVTLWSRALACTPDNPVARIHLGSAFNDQEKLDQAIQQFQRALELEPDYADARYNLGVAFEKQGKLDQAAQQFEQALRLKPDFVKAQVDLGIALARQGKLDDAARYFEQALQLEPDNAEAHYNFGIALASQGKLDDAVKHYERAIQLQPSSPSIHNNLGLVLENQGRLEEAIQHFEQALQIKPDFAQAHVNLGLALAKEGKLDLANQHLQQALDLAIAQNNPSLAAAIRTRLKSLPQPQTP